MKHTFNLPLDRYNDDTQAALADQNPSGRRHLLILYGPDDSEPNIEFVRRAVNWHDELVRLLTSAHRQVEIRAEDMRIAGASVEAVRLMDKKAAEIAGALAEMNRQQVRA